MITDSSSSENNNNTPQSHTPQINIINSYLNTAIAEEIKNNDHTLASSSSPIKSHLYLNPPRTSVTSYQLLSRSPRGSYDNSDQSFTITSPSTNTESSGYEQLSSAYELNKTQQYQLYNNSTINDNFKHMNLSNYNNISNNESYENNNVYNNNINKSNSYENNSNKLGTSTGGSNTSYTNYSCYGTLDGNKKEDNDSTLDDDDEEEIYKKDDEKKNRQELILSSREIRNSARDWNLEFQTLLKMEPSFDKFQKLTFIAMDFVKAAETYGSFIIKEMFMPPDLRTIPPIDIGGVAGGHKYICQNILFKFAYDQKIQDQWLYGGKVPSDFGASKAAGNELRGLSFFFQNVLDTDCGDKINVPLMCVIDYYGYRLLAMSLLPINKSTLIYGSCDGGQTVHDDVEEVNQMMEKISDSMNIRGHFTGINAKFLYGPGDLEIHKSLKNDKEYYSLDFGRLLPPQAIFDEYNNPIQHRDIFYKLLRPEFIRNYDKPLSSDAFSGWSANEPDHQQHNQDVAEATQHLYDVTIREAATNLESKFDDSPESFKVHFDLTLEVHKFGINLRYLGLLRSQIDSHYVVVRKYILNEMVGRVLKNELKDKLRLSLSGHLIGSEEKCIDTIIKFLNGEVFSVSRFNSEKSFWLVTIKGLLVEKYGLNCLSSEEMDHQYDLSNSIDIFNVITFFQQKTGVKLSKRIKTLLRGNQMPMVLYTDIKSINPVIKHSNMIARSEGISLYMKALEMIYSNTVYYDRLPGPPNYIQFDHTYYEEISLLDHCRQKLETASRSATTDASLYHLLGLVDIENHKLRNDKAPYIKYAEKSLQVSLSYQKTAAAIIALGTVYSIQRDFQKAEQAYRELIKFPIEQVASTLFESASLYAPYFTLPTNCNPSYLTMSLHQLVHLHILVSRQEDTHPIKIEYGYKTAKQLAVIILRFLHVKSTQILQWIINTYHSIYDLPKFTKITSTKELIKLFSPLMTSLLELYPTLLDDIILQSIKCQVGCVPLKCFVHFIPNVAILRSLVANTFMIHPISQLPENEQEQLFSDYDVATILLSLDLQYPILSTKHFDNPTILLRQQSITNLTVKNVHLDNKDQLECFYSALMPTLVNLKLQFISFETSIEISSLNLNNQECKELKSVTLETIRLSKPLLAVLFSKMHRSTETLNLKEIIHYENQLLEGFQSLKHLDLSDMYDVSAESIPHTLEKLYLSFDLINQDQSSSLSSSIMKQCPNLIEIGCNQFDDKIFRDIESLKKYSMKSISFYPTSAFRGGANFDVWSTSLKELKFNTSQLYDHKIVSDFICSLKSLSVLHLDSSNINDEVLGQFIQHLAFVEILSMGSRNIALEQQDKQWKSVRSLTISNPNIKTENYLNLGIIFPSLTNLAIQSPDYSRFTDTGFKKLLQNISHHNIQSLTLDSCPDLSDSSIIALCSSPIANTITKIHLIIDRIGDSSIIKMSETMPNLRSITSYSFKIDSSEQYFCVKYPYIQFKQLYPHPDTIWSK